jgi:ribosomal protein L11 methyltransferase
VELLQAILGSAASVYTDARTNKSVAEVYLPNQPAASVLSELKHHIRELRFVHLGIPRDGLKVQRLKRRDWAESWKLHFKPIEIERRLLIRPSWSKRKARRGQAVVVLDPGLGFGTGQHATTRFCLEQLVASGRDGQRSFLDIGTGSGILAIAAAKVGYTPIHAIDSDPDAVRIAQANARRNGVLEKVRIQCRDLVQLLPPRKGYDLVCANLTADLLLKERRRILSQVARHGRLVLAGILTAQFTTVASAYKTNGLELLQSRVNAGWKSGLFARHE